MSTLITILHIMVCLFLMLTVLLQQGKGGMGGAFGGSSAGTVFGGAGASTFLRRLTAIAATVFMLTSMILAYVASRDAGEPLEAYSKAEAARLKRKREAERKGLEGARDAGVLDDGGVAPLTLDLPGFIPDPPAGADTGTASGATGASGTTGAEVPAEAPGTATPPAGGATTTPPAGGATTTPPPAATPPATPPPAAPATGAPPAAPAPAAPGAGTATP